MALIKQIFNDTNCANHKKISVICVPLFTTWMKFVVYPQNMFLLKAISQTNSKVPAHIKNAIRF